MDNEEEKIPKVIVLEGETTTVDFTNPGTPNMSDTTVVNVGGTVTFKF